MSAQRGRAGFALPFALFALLIIGVVSALLLELAALESRNGRARLARLRARTLAASAAAAAAERWPGDTARALPRGDTLHLLDDVRDGFDRSAALERIGAESYLVRARAASPGDAAFARIGLLLRTVPPREVLETFGAALAAPGGAILGPGAVVDGTAASGPPPTSACDAAGAAILRDVFDAADLPGVVVPDAAALVAAAGATVRGLPDILARADTVRGRLGPIDVRGLRSNADAIVAGTVTPAPRAAAGVCDVADPFNWGSPAASHPCSAYAPLIVADGPLVMAGGTGQGVLVVNDDLTLTADAHFAGLIFVGGRLTLGPAARIDGLVRVEGASASLIDGELRSHACAVWRALTGAPGLRSPFLPAVHRWIPLF